MKAMVRDDIISLDAFVKARFKYEKYIQMIDDAGGYCFINQFVQHFGGESKGRHLIEQLVTNGFIQVKSMNNFKYCYLTTVSLKYLKYKDDPRDFSDIDKNYIYIKKVTQDPSEKVLLSSAIKFAIMQENELIGKTKYIEYISNVFKNICTNNENSKVDKIIDKTLSYYDKAKIIFMPSYKQIFRIDMYIIDTNTSKSVNAYLAILNEYLKYLNMSNVKIKIIIVSYSQNRAMTLNSGFTEKINKREELLKGINNKYNITDLENKIEIERMKREKIKALNDLDKNIIKFELEVLEDTFYIEKYIDNFSGYSQYIKLKDEDRFNLIRKALNEKKGNDSV